MVEGKPCDICGTEVPFKVAIVSHAIEEKTKRVLWLCRECKRKPGMIPADECDQCKEWRPREGGRPMLAEDAAGDMVEVLWLCSDCAK